MRTESRTKELQFIGIFRDRLDRQGARYTFDHCGTRHTSILRLTGTSAGDAQMLLHYRPEGIEVRMTYESDEDIGWSGFYEYGEDVEELLKIIEEHAATVS